MGVTWHILLLQGTVGPFAQFIKCYMDEVIRETLVAINYRCGCASYDFRKCWRSLQYSRRDSGGRANCMGTLFHAGDGMTTKRVHADTNNCNVTHA